MSNSITVSVGNSNFNVDSGDLTAAGVAQFVHGGMSLASDVLAAVLDRPISSLTSDELQVSLGCQTSLCWKVGDISITFGPQVQGTLCIRKAGEIFQFTESEKDDDPSTRQSVTVPTGKAYVSITLRVNLQLAGSGTFSSGNFGVCGSAELTDNFLLANYVQVDTSMPVGTAIQTAFSRFVLPFSDSAYLNIGAGNFLEYQFYGKLNVSLQASLGFTGVFFGGLSGGEVRQCFSSPIGSVTASATPQANLSLAFNVGYQHEDAFRIVLQGLPDVSRLYLFKMDRSTLSASLKASAGISVNASVDVKNPVNDLIDKAGQRIFSGVPNATIRNKLCDAFTGRLEDAAGKATSYVDEVQQRVNDQLAKLDRLKVNASIAFDRISEHAVLLTIDFKRTPAAAAGFRLAMQGNMTAAVMAPDVSLAPGSYTRSEVQRTTTLSLQLFETYRAVNIETYFDTSDIRYAGNGVFQMRFLSGVKAESDVFGHRKAIEFYFEVLASDMVKGGISDQDLNLRIKTFEEKNPEAARRTAALLHVLLRGTAQDGLDNALRNALTANPNLTVSVGMVFCPTAYHRLRFTPFVKGKPQPEQTADALNYAAFVNAVDLIYAGVGFAGHGFPDSVEQYKNWAHYNVTAIDEENAPISPNRRQQGNAAVWPHDTANFPAASVTDNQLRQMLMTYMLAAQGFMNLCEDLPTLAQNLSEADTQRKFSQVLAEVDRLVGEGTGGFPLFFTKPAAVAISSQMSGAITQVEAIVPADPMKDSFHVQIVLS